MFEYVVNEYDPAPVLHLGGRPRRTGTLAVDIPYSVSRVASVPLSLDELRSLHGAKFWSTLRRKERRLREYAPEVEFRIVREQRELVRTLPRVQQLFADRWRHEYTSLKWKSSAAFQRYAEAMLSLAQRGEAELAVLENGDKLLSFAYSIISGQTYYFFQHASTREPDYLRFSVGQILVMRLMEDLVIDPRCTAIDFMTGEADYKRWWADKEQTIFLRVEEERSVIGFARFVLRAGYHAARLHVQFRNARLRKLAKSCLSMVERVGFD